MALRPFEFVLVVLAATRATRLVTADTIADGVRDRITDGRQWWSDLLSCPYCAGWWLSLATYAVAVVALGRVHDVPWLAHALEAWAVAGAQMLANAVDVKLAD
jgi:hypothetical protein